MKKTIVRIVSTKLGEEIGDFERINFDENNEILILPTKEEISRAASELERSTHFRSNIAAQKTKRLPKKKIEEDKGFRLTASQKQLQLGAKRKRKDAKTCSIQTCDETCRSGASKTKGCSEVNDADQGGSHRGDWSRNTKRFDNKRLCSEGHG